MSSGSGVVSERAVAWMEPFRQSFTAPTWQHVLVLVTGALLVPGRRTVASALRVLGMAGTPHFSNYHRVLNRDRWCNRSLSRRLLRLLIAALAPDGPVVVGLDDTIERRWGVKIRARGIYRDPVRSSHGHFVKASGLRWLCIMLLPEIGWAGRVWALPFLTALAPSERHAREHGRRHKKLTDWGRQVLLQTARWLPDRRIVGVADSSFAVIDLLNAMRPRICMVTRLRLDARLFDPPPPRRRNAVGRPPTIGRRQPTLAKRVHARNTRWRRMRVSGWARPHRVNRRDRLRQGDLASSRTARADPLRAGARPRRRTEAAGVSVHRSRCRSARHPTLVRPPPVDRSHLCRGSPSSGGRDPTTMDRSRHRTHHARAAGACSPSSRCGPSTSSVSARYWHEPQVRISRSYRPSPMLLPLSEPRSGAGQISERLGRQKTLPIFIRTHSTASLTWPAMPHEWPKSR